MAEDIRDEHARLLREVADLERKHQQLELRPNDTAAHREHIAKLKATIAELHKHIARLKSEQA